MFRIRLALPADYPAVGILYDQVGSYHAQHLPHIFREGGALDFPYELLGEYIKIGEGAIFLAEIEKEIVGFVIVIVRNAPEMPVLQPRRLGVIDAVGVAPHARGQGIGRALMEAAHAWVKAHNASTVELNVYEFNEEARRLYEAMGYHTLSRKMGRKIED